MEMLSVLRPRITRLALPALAQLWLVYALFFAAGVAQAAIVPLLPRLSGRFDLSASQAALLLALPGLATLAVSVPSGLAADRLGARRVTLGAGALLCLSCMAQAAPSLPSLLVGRIVFGVAFGVVWTTGMAWLAELGEAAGRSGMGPAVTGSSVGIMVGPAVGGILAQHAGLGAPFAAIAAATALLIAALFGGTAETDGASEQPVAPIDLPLDIVYSQPVVRDRPPGIAPRALWAVARRPRVCAAAGGLVVSGAVSSASQLLVSGDLHRLGLSTGRIGLAFSAAAVCYIVVSAAVVRLGARAHTLRFNALATAALAGAMLPALAGDGLVALLAALLLTAGPRAVISTIAYSLASDRRSGDGGGDGVVFGLLNGAWAAATVMMPMLAGAAEQHGGSRAGYLAVIVPSCAVAAWLVLRSRSSADRPWAPVRSSILQRVLRS
jgi:MFS transporter, DHA1 family, solute carrier family 18 (vesicular amine transporter), member 1/2